MINWNMVILLVFITFNIAVICDTMKIIFISRNNANTLNGMIKEEKEEE